MTDPFRTQVATFPDQLETPAAGEGVLPPWRRLWVAGMGGSGAAGEFLRLFGGNRTIEVVHDRTLPSPAEGDAVVCISHSGETLETRSVWEEAGKAGLPRAAVTSGGALARLARGAKAPWRATPAGLAPRAALGSLLRCAAGVAGLEDEVDWGEAARAVRERVGGESPAAEVEAAAGVLSGRIPILLPAGGAADVAARRWISDLAENAKMPALLWSLPEAAHNQVMAASRSAPLRDSLAVVALAGSEGVPPEWEAVLGTLAAHGIRPFSLSARRSRPWIEALELAYLGSWVSVLLAERAGVEAGDLSLMDDIKTILRRGKEQR